MTSLCKTLSLCDTYLFDCDGVLWHESGLIPGAKAIIDHLLRTNRKVFLITNNSTKSVEQYTEKCQKLGLQVTAGNIICSSNVAANYLKAEGITGPVYVIGHSGIGLELDKVGITHFGIGPDHAENDDPMSDIHLNPETTAVLVGFDSNFNYRKLVRAVSYIGKGLPFFATNEDAQLPANGTILPGTGSIVAAVKVATEREPVVMGKPHPPIFEMLCRNHKLDPQKTVMVGDRLDTDIWFGNRFGLHTVCVMSGVTDSAQLEKIRANPNDKLLCPSFNLPSVQDLLDALQKSETT